LRILTIIYVVQAGVEIATGVAYAVGFSIGILNSRS
jgi:uncharacterized protein YebE (UPF0316 family)